MKCSYCGSEKVINTSSVPFWVTGDASMESNKNEIFICLDCAHIDFFNHYFVKEHSDNNARYIELKEKIKLIDSQIIELEVKPFDDDKYKKELKRYQEELEALILLGADNKSIRVREECIKEMEEILNARIDPKQVKQLKTLKNERTSLEQELSKYHFSE